MHILQTYKVITSKTLTTITCRYDAIYALHKLPSLERDKENCEKETLLTEIVAIVQEALENVTIRDVLEE